MFGKLEGHLERCIYLITSNLKDVKRTVNYLGDNIGLVLEGGGMRGAYTAGVLTAFIDADICFPYVIGVSAGANNGANFVSRQRDRGKKVFVDHVGHKKYSGFKNLIREGSYFGMDFLFEELPNEVEPFDYKAFYSSDTDFRVVVTNAQTAEPVYFRHRDYDPHFFMNKILRASSSLPGISKPVEIDGNRYFDGGIANPIPIGQSIRDGNDYNVIVLTQNYGYRKELETGGRIFKRFFGMRYPKIIEAMEKRHEVYNRTLDEIEELERKGLAYVFRPIEKLNVDRLERDIDKLDDLYNQGYNEAMDKLDELKSWLYDIPAGTGRR